MEKELLKINILSIAVSGLMMAVAGILLYLLKDITSRGIRFFLPIPPIGVAAYVFVFNMFKYYDGNLGEQAWNAVSEILYSTIIAAIAFCIFATVLVVSIHYLKQYL